MNTTRSYEQATTKTRRACILLYTGRGSVIILSTVIMCDATRDDTHISTKHHTCTSLPYQGSNLEWRTNEDTIFIPDKSRPLHPTESTIKQPIHLSLCFTTLEEAETPYQGHALDWDITEDSLLRMLIDKENE